MPSSRTAHSPAPPASAATPTLSRATREFKSFPPSFTATCGLESSPSKVTENEVRKGPCWSAVNKACSGVCGQMWFCRLVLQCVVFLLTHCSFLLSLPLVFGGFLNVGEKSHLLLWCQIMCCLLTELVCFICFTEFPQRWATEQADTTETYWSPIHST